MDNIFSANAQIALHLILSVVFAFLIGMQVYIRTDVEKRKYLFGSERTLALISLLGFILFSARESFNMAYVVGLVAITALLIMHSLKKQEDAPHYGITNIVLGLVVYTFPLIFHYFPIWLALLILTIIMVLLEVKTEVKNFTSKIYRDEFLTLAKFVFIAGVILPIVPNEPIVDFVPITPYKLWLAVVAISAISYLSYLLRRFAFPKAGLIITAVLGGLYSSTATTFIISRKSKDNSEMPSRYAAAIITATTMMYGRILVLMAIFNIELTVLLLPYFLILTAISGLVAIGLYRFKNNGTETVQEYKPTLQNPLELRIALIFGVLYVVFSVLTHFTLTYFGSQGLNILSFLVGMTDIDPFLLNLFQGRFESISISLIGFATLQAIISNNILKLIYALIIGNKTMKRYIIAGFGIIIIANLLVLLFL